MLLKIYFYRVECTGVYSARVRVHALPVSTVEWRCLQYILYNQSLNNNVIFYEKKKKKTHKEHGVQKMHSCAPVFFSTQRTSIIIPSGLDTIGKPCNFRHFLALTPLAIKVFRNAFCLVKSDKLDPLIYLTDAVGTGRAT